MDNTKHHYKLKLNEIYLTIVNQIPSVYIEYVKWAIILFIPIISVLYLISRILHTALVHSVHNSHWNTSIGTLIVTGVLVSFFVFLYQNVIFAKFLDNLKKNNIKYLLTNNLFIVPLQISAVLVTYTFLFLKSEKFIIKFDTTAVLPTNVNVSPELILDEISIGFLTATLWIGVFVNALTHHYMKNENQALRFVNLLNAFFFSMVFLIMSTNLITFILFWEMIGFFSYFLINFWNKKPSTFKSAMKAFTYNQLSDVALVIGALTYFYGFNTWKFPLDLNSSIITTELSISNKNVMIFCFLVAASCKSAQFLFHFWLPDSMDAPAPASALIHSATLVAAGILLILRVKPIFILSKTTTTAFSVLALITIVLGGVSATNHTDIKKILAYSTISNCGLMFFCALNISKEWSIYLFITHGLLKAASFMFAGFIIIELLHKQDYRLAGAFSATKPYISLPCTVLFLSLGALPTTTFSYIKHAALYNLLETNIPFILIDLSMSIGSITSILYSIKLVLSIFFSNKKKMKLKKTELQGMESNKDIKIILISMTVAVIILLNALIFIKVNPRSINTVLKFSPYHIFEHQAMSALFARDQLLWQDFINNSNSILNSTSATNTTHEERISSFYSENYFYNHEVINTKKAQTTNPKIMGKNLLMIKVLGTSIFALQTWSQKWRRFAHLIGIFSALLLLTSIIVIGI